MSTEVCILVTCNINNDNKSHLNYNKKTLFLLSNINVLYIYTYILLYISI